MALFNYQKSQRTADGLISKFGLLREIPLHTIPIDRSGFEPGPATDGLYICKAVVLPASKGTIQAFDNRLEGGTLIDENLRYIIMSPFIVPVVGGVRQPAVDTVTPKSLDTLDFDGDRWVILGNTPLKPAGITVYHSIGARRG